MVILIFEELWLEKAALGISECNVEMRAEVKTIFSVQFLKYTKMANC